LNLYVLIHDYTTPKQKENTSPSPSKNTSKDYDDIMTTFLCLLLLYLMFESCFSPRIVKINPQVNCIFTNKIHYAHNTQPVD